MKVRVTQLDIARVAGVHNTTVSLALRNSRLIPQATRERIQGIATELGYCPDPVLKALAAYRDSRRTARKQTALAFITNWPTRSGWRDQPWLERYFAGAERRARELGFAFEHFWLGGADMNQRRLSSVLLHRGITGAVVAAPPSCGGLDELDWSRLSAVRLGAFPAAPALNQVSVDFGGVVSLAVDRTRGSGYRRIGFVVSRWWDDFAGQAWSRMIGAKQIELPAEERLPVLTLGADWPTLDGTGQPAASPSDIQNFVRWFKGCQPEVVVGLAPGIFAQFEKIGLAVPKEAAFADLFLEGAAGQCAGVRQNCERAGELAVEALAGQLQRNEFGLPSVPTVTSVTGTWVDGLTLPVASGRILGRLRLTGSTRVNHDLVA